MHDLLKTFADRSAQRASALDAADLRARVADLPPPPALEHGAFGVIAEFKRRSPSSPDLGHDLDQAVATYTAAGATAISVLTEPTGFGGSVADLERATSLTHRPVLRKDFLVDERQLLEARVAGASGVLLMASIVEPPRLTDLMGAARAHGLFVLAEAHDAAELAQVHEARDAVGDDHVLVGVNTRDFATLTTDLSRLADLQPELRPDVTYVAESGIQVPADTALARQLGYRLALVGTSLLRSSNPEAQLRALIGAGRVACLLSA